MEQPPGFFAQGEFGLVCKLRVLDINNLFEKKLLN